MDLKRQLSEIKTEDNSPASALKGIGEEIPN